MGKDNWGSCYNYDETDVWDNLSLPDTTDTKPAVFERKGKNGYRLASAVVGVLVGAATYFGLGSPTANEVLALMLSRGATVAAAPDLARQYGTSMDVGVGLPGEVSMEASSLVSEQTQLPDNARVFENGAVLYLNQETGLPERYTLPDGSEVVISRESVESAINRAREVGFSQVVEGSVQVSNLVSETVGTPDTDYHGVPMPEAEIDVNYFNDKELAGYGVTVIGTPSVNIRLPRNPGMAHFLETVQKGGKPLTIFLVNGETLTEKNMTPEQWAIFSSPHSGMLGGSGVANIDETTARVVGQHVNTAKRDREYRERSFGDPEGDTRGWVSQMVDYYNGRRAETPSDMNNVLIDEAFQVGVLESGLLPQGVQTDIFSRQVDGAFGQYKTREGIKYIFVAAGNSGTRYSWIEYGLVVDYYGNFNVVGIGRTAGGGGRTNADVTKSLSHEFGHILETYSPGHSQRSHEEIEAAADEFALGFGEMGVQRGDKIYRELIEKAFSQSKHSMGN